MPITLVNNVVTPTAMYYGFQANQTGVFNELDWAVCNQSNVVKQVKFDITDGDNTAASLTLSCTITGDATLHLTNLQTTAGGYVGVGVAPTTNLHSKETKTIAALTADGTSGALTIEPVYTATGAQTVTRSNYIVAKNVDGGANVTTTDAALVRFDANAGTHKAVDGATTKTTPGGVDAWVKINVNGTIMYVPAYTSKTA